MYYYQHRHHQFVATYQSSRTLPGDRLPSSVSRQVAAMCQHDMDIHYANSVNEKHSHNRVHYDTI